MKTMSSPRRTELNAALIGHIRQFIAGSILFNQQVAERTGLRLTDMQCLNVLELLGPSTPGTLAACTGLTTGGVTVMLDRLERAEYVKRAPNPADRRSRGQPRPSLDGRAVEIRLELAAALVRADRCH